VEKYPLFSVDIFHRKLAELVVKIQHPMITLKMFPIEILSQLNVF